MPTLNQVRNAVDNFLAAKWPTVVARQEAYFAAHGHYWQGLKTHSTPPAFTSQQDGSSVPDRFDRSPSDQSSRWIDALPEWAADLFPMSLTIDVYQSPEGHGWVATVEATHNGTLYRRSKNVGPEEWRTEGWHAVTGGPG